MDRKYYFFGLVAQWTRARGYEPRCQGFESLLAQSNNVVDFNFFFNLEFPGVSPSGKATDFDSVIRRFESCHPRSSKNCFAIVEVSV